MKKVLKVILVLLLIVVLAIGGFAAFISIRGIPKYEVEKIDFPKVEVTPERIAQGTKIASVQCVVCHRGADGKLSGRLMQELPPEFGEIHSANITQSKEHGIGNWSDAELAYFIRTGVRHQNGQYAPMYMPKYPHMSDEDLKSIIAFLRSQDAMVQASETPKGECKPSFLTKFLCLVAFKKIPYPTAAIVEPDSNDLVAYGKYLVTGRYDCYPCHSKDFKTVKQDAPETSEGYMGGGNALITMNGNIIYTANITPDEETGIGRWTEEDFANVMRNMKNKDGHNIRPPMIPMNTLTDAEIRGMYKYIMSLPKIKNKVDRQWDKEEI